MSYINKEIFSDVNKVLVMKFEKHNQANPHIYEMFYKYANDLRLAGVKRHGAKSIMERLRWDFAFDTKGDSFKITNSYTSMYARLLILNQPEFDGFFKLRGRVV